MNANVKIQKPYVCRCCRVVIPGDGPEREKMEAEYLRFIEKENAQKTLVKEAQKEWDKFFRPTLSLKTVILGILWLIIPLSVNLYESVASGGSSWLYLVTFVVIFIVAVKVGNIYDADKSHQEQVAKVAFCHDKRTRKFAEILGFTN